MASSTRGNTLQHYFHALQQAEQPTEQGGRPTYSGRMSSRITSTLQAEGGPLPSITSTYLNVAACFFIDIPGWMPHVSLMRSATPGSA